MVDNNSQSTTSSDDASQPPKFTFPDSTHELIEQHTRRLFDCCAVIGAVNNPMSVFAKHITLKNVELTKVGTTTLKKAAGLSMMDTMHTDVIIRLWRQEMANIKKVTDRFTKVVRTISLLYCMTYEDHYMMDNEDERDLQKLLNEASTIYKAVLATAEGEEVKCLNLMGKNLAHVVSQSPWGTDGGCDGTVKFKNL